MISKEESGRAGLSSDENDLLDVEARLEVA